MESIFATAGFSINDGDVALDDLGDEVVIIHNGTTKTATASATTQHVFEARELFSTCFALPPTPRYVKLDNPMMIFVDNIIESKICFH